MYSNKTINDYSPTFFIVMPFYLIFGTQHIMLIEREIKEDKGREWRTWRRAELEKDQRKEEIRGMYRKYIEEGLKEEEKQGE
jgi:hypothetical protein